jgi:hypothetical protein
VARGKRKDGLCRRRPLGAHRLSRDMECISVGSVHGVGVKKGEARVDLRKSRCGTHDEAASSGDNGATVIAAVDHAQWEFPPIPGVTAESWMSWIGPCRSSGRVAM